MLAVVLCFYFLCFFSSTGFAADKNACGVKAVNFKQGDTFVKLGEATIKAKSEDTRESAASSTSECAGELIVLDLGGGTFDVDIKQCGDDTTDVTITVETKDDFAVMKTENSIIKPKYDGSDSLLGLEMYARKNSNYKKEFKNMKEKIAGNGYVVDSYTPSCKDGMS